MQTSLQERKLLYRRIRGLSEDKYAKVMKFVLSMEVMNRLFPPRRRRTFDLRTLK